jgi:DNA-binding CsgD family transcriptional regulator/tetratricopeptide (TPR) repeat protein
MGKSRLLEEARALAAEAGFRISSGHPPSRQSGVPFEPLLTAFFEGDEPLFGLEQLRALGPDPGQPYWFVQELQALLEQAALTAPLLIVVDDLQWADPGTLLALRTMPRGLAGLPAVWLLSTRTREATAELRATTALLQRHGATALPLKTLDAPAVATIVADVLGGEGDAKLLRLADRGRGSPYLLNELLEGLQEDDLVRVVDGRAELTADRLPDRLGKSMRERVEALTPEAQQLVRVASILGSRFSFEVLAAMLQRPATAIIEPLDEVMAADFLIAADDRLAFRHDLLHEAVLATLPPSLRRALHEQAAAVLQDLGAGPVAVAHHLSASAQVGDADAIAALQAAVAVLSTSDAGAAADLSLRALALTAREDPARGALVAQTSQLLYAALRFTEGDAVAGEVLDGVISSEQETDLLLSHVTTHVQWSQSGRTEADILRVTGLLGLSAAVRARHLSGLALNLPVAGRFKEGWELAPSALQAARESGDATALGFAALGVAILEQSRGRYAAGLELLDEAHAHFLNTEAIQTRVVGVTSVQAVRSRMLSDCGRVDEALAVYEEGMAVAQRDRDDWSLWVWLVYGSQLLVESGRIADARAHIEAAEMTSALTDSVMEPLAVFTRVSVAVHTGDDELLHELERRARAVHGGGNPTRRRWAGWILAVAANHRGDAAEAATWLEDEELPYAVGTPWGPEYALPALVVRTALAADGPELARAAVGQAELYERENPGVPFLTAAAQHARGLLRRDPAEVLAGVAILRDAGRPLWLAAALQDAYGLLADTDPPAAVDLLREALVVWTAAGATADADRVTQLLSTLGVEPALSTRSDADERWSMLTPTELSVVRAVAGGETNRDVGRSLSLPPETVSAHLHHAFATLGVSSRVELTRLVREHDSRR